MSGRTAFDVDLARTLIERKRAMRGPMLPILHDLQEQFGYIDERVIPLLADALNVSRAETLGAISFYHDFRRSPVDGRVLKLCRAESCQAAGGDALAARAEERLRVEMGGTTADARVTLEAVYCLGLCHSSPAAMLDHDVFGMLDERKLDALLKEAQA